MGSADDALWWWLAQESRCSGNHEGFYVGCYYFCRALLGLMWLKNLSVVFHFAKMVHHPGNKPDKWMDRAAAKATDIFRQHLYRLITQA